MRVRGDDLVKDLKKLRKGRGILTSSIISHVGPALGEADCPLSDRELEILRMVEEDRTATDIAYALHLSAGTVRNYISSAMTKLDARNRAHAVRIARDQGWI
ncbi:response regulator transcription factor [Kibdelosporangium lantanae]|uniref:Response regulator transcription factor n=1 Tax=Kibdelosporangium lantanae TaxID=1497396 RepID=A0ABW3MFH9_9PSEU